MGNEEIKAFGVGHLVLVRPMRLAACWIQELSEEEMSLTSLKTESSIVDL